jgi:arsenate reductase
VKKKVLFVCTHNSNRSQMAEGFLRDLYPNKYEAFSAGTKPTHVSPDAIEVMKEAGIDIALHRSKNMDEYRGEVFDYVVTVCDNARETCPFFPASKKNMHRSFDNPWEFRGTRGEVLGELRRVRDEIRAWIVRTFGEDGEERLEEDTVFRPSWPGTRDPE